MPKPQKQKPFDITLSDDKLQELGETICREVDEAFNARASVIDDGGLIDYADWYYEQGKSDAADLPFPGAADLTSYIICENVDAFHARLMKAVFGVQPLCFVRGRGPSAQKAPVTEAFLEWQVNEGDLKEELDKTIHGALIEDGYILEVSEKIETRKLVEEMDVALELHPETGGPIFENGQPKLKMDENGEPVTAQPTEPAAKVRRTSTKTRRLGPQFDPISMKEFVFLPGHAKTQRQVWGYAYRIWDRLPELREKVADGIYDPRAVDKIGQSSDRESESVPPTVDTVAYQEGDAIEKELFQVSLKRDLDGDGREEWYVATVSTRFRALLRLKLDTFAMKVGRPRCVPFILFPRRNSVYGYSYAFSKLLTLAEEHSALRNMKADRGALATNKPIMQMATGIWDPEAQPMGVGAIITVRDANELRELQVSDVPVSVVEQEHAIMNAKERVGGLSDAAVGVLSTERRTLGENKLVSGGSAVRVDVVVGRLQRALATVYKLTHAIYVDMLKESKSGLQAPEDVTSAIQQRGDAYAQFDGTFTSDAIDGEFQFVPYGSTETADPEKQRNDFDGFVVALTKLAPVVPGLQAVLANPEANKAILEQLLRSYNVRDTQPFLGALAMPVAPAAGGMGPEAMPPGAGGMPPGMPHPGMMPGGGAGAGAPDIHALMAALGQGAPGAH